MPLYDFVCQTETCKSFDIPVEKLCKYDDRHSIACSDCQCNMKPLIAKSRFIPFKKGWYEHIGPNPIYIESKQQLARECEKHNKYSVYLLDN